MRLLLDTHLLLWVSLGSRRLKPAVRRLIEDPENELTFSAASIWEVAIKTRMARSDFTADPIILRRGLLDADFEELPITSMHAAATQSLPLIHHDPFDRILIAQALVEGARLITSDEQVAAYDAPILKV